MEAFYSTVFCTIAGLYLFIVLFSFTTKYNDFFCKAPGLDFSVAIFTFIPWCIAYYYYAWAGVFYSLISELIVLYSFNFIHERFIHKYQGPKIHKTLNKVVGFVRNHLALFFCLLALPIFLLIRLGQIFVYPLLRWTLAFPKYKAADWINVSRYKFDGLVGHDMVWCLYCDWMTGVFALAGEMLRNVESFWCPIRFYEGKKCENCKLDFPDIEKWVPADGSMKDVEQLLLEKYPPESKKPRTWFGYKN